VKADRLGFEAATCQSQVQRPTAAPPRNTGWANIALFDRSRSLWLRRLTPENLCQSTTVVRVHDGALAEEYALSSTTFVVVEVCLSHLRLTSAMHVCAILELIATVRLCRQPNKK